MNQEELLSQMAANVSQMLDLIGEDKNREGLVKTPMRVAKSLQFLTQGYQQDPAEIIRSAMFREDYRQMVIVKDIDFYSMCEHHMFAILRQGACRLYS